MRILVVATKLPWPARDGGRLVLAATLEALADAGHRQCVVAPRTTADPEVELPAALRDAVQLHPVPVGAIPWPVAALRALQRGEAVGIARHRHAGVEIEVARQIARWKPDVVHVEQLQAWAHVAPARAAGVPTLLRMQNVESDLWAGLARTGGARRLLRFQARRLRRAEREAMRAATRVLALTEEDATALRTIADHDGVAIHALAPPFAAARLAGRRLEGAPAVAVSGSTGWRPNSDALAWSLRELAPRLQARCPDARLHVFAADLPAAPGVVAHAPPRDAIDAFPAGAIAAVPLFVGSGIRMRILEAWARGLPVVATPVAAAGLGAEHRRELLLASDADGFVDAILQLHADASLRAKLVAAGHAALASRHDPATQAAALLAHYRALQQA